TYACRDSAKSQIPTCVSFMHTACVWSEKLPFAGYSVVKELLHNRGSAPNPGSVARGAPKPHSAPSQARCARLGCHSLTLSTATNFQKSPSAFALLRFGPTPSLATAAWLANRSSLRLADRSQASSERRLENTGLEPVTSWLQTRRSPS